MGNHFAHVTLDLRKAPLIYDFLITLIVIDLKLQLSNLTVN